MDERVHHTTALFVLNVLCSEFVNNCLDTWVTVMFLLFLYWCTWLDVFFKIRLYLWFNILILIYPYQPEVISLKKPAFIHLEMLDRIVPILSSSLPYGTVAYICNLVPFRPELLYIETKSNILYIFCVGNTTFSNIIFVHFSKNTIFLANTFCAY